MLGRIGRSAHTRARTQAAEHARARRLELESGHRAPARKGCGILSCVFERFTERARQVVVLAQEEARILMHAYIGTEHILLGLLREQEGIAARVLDSLGISVDDVRPEVVRIVGSGEGVTPSQIPFTPRAKNVLESALREALSLGHNHIGPEHILLGLVRADEGVATRILLDFDADAQKIQHEILRMLSGHGRQYTPDHPRQPGLRTLPHVETDDGLSRLIEAVAPQIAQHLDRPVDAGDLLVALASVPDGLVARTLTALGVEPAALMQAVAEARGAPTPSGLGGLVALDEEIETVREQKRANTKVASELRDRESQLVAQARELDEHRLDHALAEFRNRLELPAL